MSRAPLIAAALIGALVAWLAAETLSSPDPVPDTTGPLVEDVERAAASRDSAIAVADSVREAYEDSLSAWDETRDSLRAVTERAREQADSIASALRVTLTEPQADMLDRVRAEHRAEVRGVAAERDTYREQVAVLEVRVESQAALIESYEDEVWAWEELDAERRRINEDLRDELGKQKRNNRITLAVGAVAVLGALLR